VRPKSDCSRSAGPARRSMSRHGGDSRAAGARGGRCRDAGGGRGQRRALSARQEKHVPAGTCVVDGSHEAPTMEHQQADALALVAETALHRGMDPGAPGERYQVVVHVDAQVLADADAPGQSVLEGGARVPAGTSQRLACDASRVMIRHDAEGRITEVGARTRTIPPALRRALQHRDKGCRRHWAHGGPTKLSNLGMPCRRHHRAVHEEDFQAPPGSPLGSRPHCTVRSRW
jgi:Domain of unknown function (DUF222)